MEYRELFVAFSFGWAFGAGVMYFYFISTRLMRTRYEWYADRKARGYSVPDDWDKLKDI